MPRITRIYDESGYLTTNEQNDVLVSLCEVQHQLARIMEGNTQCWKWSIIALASAVNGTLTCNLSGTMQIGALRNEDAQATIAGLQADSHTKLPSKPRLETPDKLLKRAQRDDKRLERAGAILQVTPEQKKSFSRLFEFRNAFLHFEPLGWSIETGGLPKMFQDNIGLIRQASNDGWSFRHLEDRETVELRDLLDTLMEHLGAMSQESA